MSLREKLKDFNGVAEALSGAASLKLMNDVALGVAVGDVNSEERGSGARYNAGKAPVELIPVWIIAESEGHRPKGDQAQHEAWKVLRALGEWQRGLGALDEAIAHLPLEAWAEAAAVFDYGRKKYAEWNWAKGMKWSVPTACAVRHIVFGIFRGEQNDPESGLPHRGHLLCNLIMLKQFESTYPEGDDRPLKWLKPSKESSGFNPLFDR